jgi:adenylate kinase
VILIMGPAGAGKSVQAQMLVDSLGYEWVSTGVVLRQAMQDPEIRQKMEHGELLDDSVVEDIVAKALKQAKDKEKVILDGFPRDHHQARWLTGFCAGGEMTLEAVIHLEISLDVARKRLLGRGRTDDHDDAIKKRFDEYEHITTPILEYMKKQDVAICDVDANQDIAKVHDDIVKVLEDVHQS